MRDVVNKLTDHLRARYARYQRDRALRLRIQTIEARMRRDAVVPNLHRDQERDRLILQHDALLNLGWEHRWGVWEGDDGLWYGMVRDIGGWVLHGPFSDHTNAAHLTEYADRLTRQLASEELHKLRNWKGYYGRG